MAWVELETQKHPKTVRFFVGLCFSTFFGVGQNIQLQQYQLLAGLTRFSRRQPLPLWEFTAPGKPRRGSQVTRGVQVVLENRTCADSPCMQFANRFEQMDNYIYMCVCMCYIYIYLFIYLFDLSIYLFIVYVYIYSVCICIYIQCAYVYIYSVCVCTCCVYVCIS